MNTPEGSPAVSPGHIVGGGHYSLHVPLGESGLMWLAQDEEAQRLAAIRFLPHEIRQDARVRELLKTRVNAALKVQHENVCRTLEWYESPGVETFIAMEYVEGKSLVQAMSGGPGQPIPWDWLMPAAASIACGLEALHRAGVVHHGLTPENLMIASDKRVKLLNTVVTGALKNPLLAPSVLNELSAIRCFSPQQLTGSEPTPADDFYSLGATLFELLTGTPLFADSNSLLEDIQNAPTPVLRERMGKLQITHSIPDAVVDFIQECLHRDATQRPKSFQTILPKSPIAIPVAPAKQAVKEPEPEPLRLAQTAVVAPVALHAELELVRKARDARRRSKAPLAIAATIAVLAGAVAAWFIAEQQKEGKQRIAEVAAKESRERELVEKQKGEVERKLQQETAARLKSEEEARKAQARLAAAAEEKRRAADQALALREKEELAKAEQQSKKPGPPPLPSTSTNGFVSMFNGTDLSGWSGNANYWSVKDGFITAQAKQGDPKERFLLVWDKGTVSDFEMHFSYRFRLLRGNKDPNGGVNYRLSGETNLTCYQFDLVNRTRDVGSVNDDKKRNRLAGHGESVIATSGGNKNELLEQIGDTNKINGIKPEDWNKCVIIAKGNRLTHYINGLMVADVTDESKSKRHLQGLITLELYTRNTNNCATFLQFNDLSIKKSGSSSPIASSK